MEEWDEWIKVLIKMGENKMTVRKQGGKDQKEGKNRQEGRNKKLNIYMDDKKNLKKKN